MEVLLTASYWSQVVKECYASEWSGAYIDKNQQNLRTFTMNIDSEHVPKWGRWRLYPSLDPKGHSLDDLERVSTDSTYSGWGANAAELGVTYGDGSFSDDGDYYIAKGTPGYEDGVTNETKW